MKADKSSDIQYSVLSNRHKVHLLHKVHSLPLYTLLSTRSGPGWMKSMSTLLSAQDSWTWIWRMEMILFSLPNPLGGVTPGINHFKVIASLKMHFSPLFSLPTFNYTKLMVLLPLENFIDKMCLFHWSSLVLWFSFFFVLFVFIISSLFWLILLLTFLAGLFAYLLYFFLSFYMSGFCFLSQNN